MIDRRPGEGRYAQLEREQRWLASGVPAGATRVAEITDRYLDGTRLRLRRMAAADTVVFKLAQKVRLVEADPTLVKVTNMYVSAEEYEVLAAVPGHDLRKLRWHYGWNGHTIAVDDFLDRWAGLVLAEVELGPDDEPLPSPDFARREVSSDDRFSGGTLAKATIEVVARLLEEIRPEPGTVRVVAP